MTINGVNSTDHRIRHSEFLTFYGEEKNVVFFHDITRLTYYMNVIMDAICTYGAMVSIYRFIFQKPKKGLIDSQTKFQTIVMFYSTESKENYENRQMFETH
ncbi:hypothetical protein A3Q56_02305 [Intoshia linei]|uniref:Uncharacterized protein n=1 Tax=Intoshia linei TaxID=1819745 RepID=A0A177B8G9_9BILA|nr:hypothetical protein A3Q56_02305 [Intoshia linei]